MYVLIIDNVIIAWGTEMECHIVWQAMDDAFNRAHDAQILPAS